MKTACMDMGFDEILDKVNQELVGHGLHLPADFTFRWAGVAFTGRLAAIDGYMITLTGRLGRLPFSAENATARRAARHALAECLAECLAGCGGHYHLGRDGAISFEAATRFPPPLSAPAIMGVLAVSLLQIKPFLKRFDGLLTRCN